MLKKFLPIFFLGCLFLFVGCDLINTTFNKKPKDYQSSSSNGDRPENPVIDQSISVFPFLDVSLKWLASKNAGYYNVYVKKDLDTISYVYSISNSTICRITNLACGLYHWKIEAISADGKLKSDLMSGNDFYAYQLTNEIPQLLFPSNNETILEGEQYFQFQPSSNVAFYQMKITGPDNYFNTNDTSMTYYQTYLNTCGKYRCDLNIMHSNGNLTATNSSVFNILPDAPQDLSVKGLDGDGNIQFSWNYSKTLLGYQDFVVFLNSSDSNPSTTNHVNLVTNFVVLNITNIGSYTWSATAVGNDSLQSPLVPGSNFSVAKAVVLTPTNGTIFNHAGTIPSGFSVQSSTNVKLYHMTTIGPSNSIPDGITNSWATTYSMVSTIYIQYPGNWQFSMYLEYNNGMTTLKDTRYFTVLP